MCFGFHRDSEHGVALFFDERGEANVFTADCKNHVVCKVETGKVRFGNDLFYGLAVWELLLGKCL